ncbi:Uncharacterized protein Adt_22364 [Abeliophyllum distichum]|uniref:Uncharacterized protein n=1 Tax=Abeliophyllum distichum TaxID=126358 RepID=A0ABD1T233_9LAMI
MKGEMVLKDPMGCSRNPPDVYMARKVAAVQGGSGSNWSGLKKKSNYETNFTSDVLLMVIQFISMLPSMRKLHEFSSMIILLRYKMSGRFVERSEAEEAWN